jgi:phosphinothricin acetyltransferase
MDASVHVRDATPADFERINEIYNWTIVDNHVSFEIEPWDLARRRRWWDGRPDGLDVLVAELAGEVVGVAYSSFYRPKPAYRSSAETTIVLDTGYLQRGIGTALLGALIERVRQRDFHRAVAIIALPNDASIALHHRLGYRTIGTLTEVGHKFDRYWDTTLLELDLG